MVDQNKIIELTKLAENGDSDKLAQGFAQIPGEEHLTVGRSIAEQSQKDHAANASLPVVELSEKTDPKAGQVVEKLESVGPRSLFHPTSWISGESRSVVYTEPKPSAVSEALNNAEQTLEKLNVFKRIADALAKATHGGDQQ